MEGVSFLGGRFLRLIAFLCMSALAFFSEAVCLNGKPSIELELKSSQFVFSAEVIDEKSIMGLQNTSDATVYGLRIIEVFKGDTQETIVAYSHNDSGRFPMILGENYLIFSDKSDSPIFINSCGNSTLIDKKNRKIEEVRDIVENKN
jgi:hypothetical protein